MKHLIFTIHKTARRAEHSEDFALADRLVFEGLYDFRIYESIRVV